MAKYKRFKENGIVFVFKLEDPPYESLLHIYARHLKNPGDAIWIFFNGTALWNQERNAFITTLGNEELKWFWLDEAKTTVMVVHCLNIN